MKKIIKILINIVLWVIVCFNLVGFVFTRIWNYFFNVILFGVILYYANKKQIKGIKKNNKLTTEEEIAMKEVVL